MTSAQQLITENIDLWTSAVAAKSASGRGTSNKRELYGIKKLRELILELAVRGKLVPQDPNDEPAAVLLERIAAEKAQLVKDKKIKKPKALPAIGEEKKPFELPQGWIWVRMGELFNSILSGGTPSKREPSYWGGDIPWASVKDLGKERYIYSTEDYITDSGLNAGSKLADAGDLLICTRMGLGKIGIAKRQIAFNQDLKAVKLASKVDVEFFLNTYATVKIKGTGTTVAGIKQEQLMGYVIGLPPEEEQHRIVAKVDELMALCDQLEQQTESSLDAHATLVDTLLATLTNSANADELAANWTRIADHFDTLFTTEQSIDALKQTILQLAVMGKLVPQDPSDEPAAQLFGRLAVDRDTWLQEEAKENSEAKTMLRKLKKLTEPKAPFELPKAWTCVHLIQLSRMLVDCHNKTAPYVDAGIPIIRTTNIRERQFVERDLKYINQETYDYWSRRCPPEQGDIIFTREAPMGEALIIPKGAKWCLGQRTMLVRPMHDFVSNEFLLLALTEPHLLERASEHAVGLTVKHLRVGDVENLNIPLPPLDEQHRIVAKVDELMALCDQLKQRLSQAQKTQLYLADAITKEALS